MIYSYLDIIIIIIQALVMRLFVFEHRKGAHSEPRQSPIIFYKVQFLSFSEM